MIKKARVSDLKPGVFIHDFNCDWSVDNLYIEQNYIHDPGIIEILKSWGIKEVYIDTDKGADVTTPKPTRHNGSESVEFTTNKNESTWGKIARVPLKKELEPARKIASEAVNLVQQVNQQVMEGKPIEAGQTYDLALKMKDSINRNRDALLLLTRIRKKDEYTLYHSISVSSLVLNMCRYYKLPDQQSLDLAVGALFHDIGKTIVPQNILNKPGKLTEKEYSEIQKHVEHSINLLSDAEGLPLECYDIALHHHERFDGSGYPHGLKMNQISFGAQLTCICDVFDAITSERCYKTAMDTVLGLRKIYEGRDKCFSKKIAHDFIKCIGIYPVGTYVVLSDGRAGMVVSTTDNMDEPVVHVFYDEHKEERVKPHRVDLSRSEDTITSYGDPKKFGLTSKQLLAKILST